MNSMFLVGLLVVYGSFSEAGYVARQPASPTCGRTFVTPKTPGRARIVNGVEAAPHSFPWMASLQVKRDGSIGHNCGGALVRVNDEEMSDIIVTAAHCLNTSNPNEKTTHVLLGGHYQNKPVAGQELVEVAGYKPHPDYSNVNQYNDIAILKLKKPVKFSNTTQPICLPPHNNPVPPVNTAGIVAGWGLLKESGDLASVLMQAVLPVYHVQQCQKDYGNLINPAIMFCAGFADGRQDSCTADSGGPYFVKSSDGSYMLHGVVSFGNGCARKNAPGVYATVSVHIPWIKREIEAMTSMKKSG